MDARPSIIKDLDEGGVSMKINSNFDRLPGNYLFNDIAKKIADYQRVYPNSKIVKLTIGDVTQPLPEGVVKQLIQAGKDQLNPETFKGYGPSTGYSFLKQAIIENAYKELGVDLIEEEVFISDGSKTDAGAIQELFSLDAKIAIGDPAYPTYIDSNVMAGRLGTYDKVSKSWSDLIIIPMTADNQYQPQPPSENDVVPHVIYLCSPNNPTGVALTKEQLQAWVDYANKHESVIIYDGAYEAFIQDDDVPHSIYECVGAKQCAIEMRSFSKTAGFTGMRIGYTVIPKELVIEGHSLNALWTRRQPTKFNGTSYIIQKAALATFNPVVKEQLDLNIAYYQRNAQYMVDAFIDANIEYYGGINAPYIWLKTPRGLSSWEYFDELLNETQVVITPGSGYGANGEGFMRLTAFGTYEDTLVATQKIVENYNN